MPKDFNTIKAFDQTFPTYGTGTVCVGSGYKLIGSFIDTNGVLQAPHAYLSATRFDPNKGGFGLDITSETANSPANGQAVVTVTGIRLNY